MVRAKNHRSFDVVYGSNVCARIIAPNQGKVWPMLNQCVQDWDFPMLEVKLTPNVGLVEGNTRVTFLDESLAPIRREE